MANILLTGTPGTGKTSVARAFSKTAAYKVIGVNEAVGDDYLYVESGTKVVDPAVISKKIRPLLNKDSVIEGHLAQLMDIEGIVIVLRTHPRELRKRLKKKGFSLKKLEENLEAEAVDVCLIESLDLYERVYEIDTTGKSPEEVAGSISLIVDGKTVDYKPGGISWLEDYVDSLEK